MKIRFPFSNMVWVGRTFSPRETGSSLLWPGSYFTAQWGVQQQEFVCSIPPRPSSVRKSTLRCKTAITEQSQEPSNTPPALQQQIKYHSLTHSQTTLSEDREDLQLFLTSLYSAAQLHHKSCTFLVVFSAKSNLGMKQNITSFWIQVEWRL